ncbi:MAG: replication initiation protein, partial [Gallionellaceae bacterium]
MSGQGLRLDKVHALACDYIQASSSDMRHCVILDIDRREGYCTHHRYDVPEPSLYVCSKITDHAHAVYLLKNSVCTSAKARPAPIAYMDGVTRGLARKASADMGYAGHMTYSPMSDNSYVWRGRAKPYSLAELSEGLTATDKIAIPARSANTSIISEGERNTTTFREARRIAAAYGCADLLQRLLDYNMQYNSPPLSLSEITATVKSVTRYAEQHGGISPSNGYASKGYTPEQVRAAQVKAARETASKKASKTTSKIDDAYAHFREQKTDPTNKQIMDFCGVSLSAVYRYKKN